MAKLGCCLQLSTSKIIVLLFELITDPLHVRGNAANLGKEQYDFFLHENRSQFPEANIVILFCPPDWLHSHYVQGCKQKMRPLTDCY